MLQNQKTDDWVKFMSPQITLVLPDKGDQQTESFVRLPNRDLEMVLVDTIDLSILSIRPQAEPLKSIVELTDKDI